MPEQLGSCLSWNTLPAEICSEGVTVCMNVLFFNAELLVRAVQLGVQIGEMDLLTIGTINDMYTEMENDENQGAYSTLASKDDMDRF